MLNYDRGHNRSVYLVIVTTSLLYLTLVVMGVVQVIWRV